MDREDLEKTIDPVEFKRLEKLTIKNALNGKLRALERFAEWTTNWSFAKHHHDYQLNPPQEWMDALDQLKARGLIVEYESELLECTSYSVADNAKEILEKEREAS